MTTVDALLTLQDIADLARVQRSVVSKWRARPRVRGRLMPFPAPADTTGGTERFARDAIVEWLERTGRGNNPEVRLDAPALDPPPAAGLNTLVTLLCLRSLLDDDLTGTTAAERAAHAGEIDPGDEFLLREITTATPSTAELRFVDDLMAASFGAADALDRLDGGRLGRALGARDVTPDAIDLLRAVAAGCRLHLGEDATLVHLGGAQSWALPVAEPFGRLAAPGDDPDRRALRRRAAIRGRDVAAPDDGPTVWLCSVLGREPQAALDALDDIVLELGSGDVAVLVGSAGVLCDELRGALEHARAATLRSAALVLALRLPRGLWREAHRQALGVWICVGGADMHRPRVADLGALPRAEVDQGDLTADVAAVLARDGRRAFRYARPHELATILAARAAVVPRGVRAARPETTNATTHLSRIQAATLITAEPIPGHDVLVTAASGAMERHHRSLGELATSSLARMRCGTRVDVAHADPAGTVVVLGAHEGAVSCALDPFDVAERYPRAARTEPGDVVFAERPRPRALVDDHGGSLVGSPSRILRLHPTAGIGPHTLATLINRLPAEATEWQGWSIPVLDATAADGLETALRAAAAHRGAVRARLDTVDELIAALIDGVAAGAVTPAPPNTTLGPLHRAQNEKGP